MSSKNYYSIKNTNIKISKKNIKNGNLIDKHTNSEKFVFSLVFIFLVVYSVTLIFPLVWVINNSLKHSFEYIKYSTFRLPEVPLLSNYLASFKQLTLDNGTSFLEMTFNSLWFSIISSATSVFISSITGYCMSKYQFKANKVIYALAIFSMTIPIVGSAASSFKLMKAIHIYDTPIYAVIASMYAWGFGFLVMYGFFSNVSWSYAEAVFVDGGGHFTVFFKIMLPQALGPITTLFILSFIGDWNNYLTMIMYMPSYQTIASGLYMFKSAAGRSIDYPIYYAGLIISAIPILILFGFASDIIMTNLSTGGLKG